MVSLLDIGPLTEEVEIGGVTLKVRGLSAKHLFDLFSEFPHIRKMIEEKKDATPQELMMSLAPKLIGKIVAFATNTPLNKEVEDKVLEMSPDDLMNILEAIQRLSFKKGLGPFVDRVTSLFNLTTVEQGSTTSSDSTTRSPAQFSALLQMDTPELMRGHARRVN